jgi:hypothetical protein
VEISGYFVSWFDGRRLEICIGDREFVRQRALNVFVYQWGISLRTDIFGGNRMDSIKGFLRRFIILVFYLSPFLYLTSGTLAHDYINEKLSWLPALHVFVIIGLALNFVVFLRFGKLLYYSFVRQYSRMGFRPIAASLIVGWTIGILPSIFGLVLYFFGVSLAEFMTLSAISFLLNSMWLFIHLSLARRRSRVWFE